MRFLGRYTVNPKLQTVFIVCGLWTGLVSSTVSAQPTITPESMIVDSGLGVGQGSQVVVASNGTDYLAGFNRTPGGTIYLTRLTENGTSPTQLIPLPIRGYPAGLVYDGTQYVLMLTQGTTSNPGPLLAIRVSTTGQAIDQTPVQLIANFSIGQRLDAHCAVGVCMGVYSNLTEIRSVRWTWTSTLATDAATVVATPQVFFNPAISSDGTNFLVTWTHFTSNSVLNGRPVAIEGVRVSPTGVVLDSQPIAYVPGLSLSTIPPSVSHLAYNGSHYLLEWDGVGGISTIRISPSGIAVDSTPTTVSQPLPPRPSIAYNYIDGDATVQSVAGNFVLTWVIRHQPTGFGSDLYSVYTRTVSPNNTAMGNQTPIRQDVDALINLSSAATASQVLTAWDDYHTRPITTSMVLGTRLDSTGNITDQSPVSLSPGYTQQQSFNAAHGNEQWLLTWNELPQGISSTEAVQYAARLSELGVVLDTTPIVIGPNPSQYREVAYSNNTYLLMHTDSTNATIIRYDSNGQRGSEQVIPLGSNVSTARLRCNSRGCLIAWGQWNNGSYELLTGTLDLQGMWHPQATPVATGLFSPDFRLTVANDNYVLRWYVSTTMQAILDPSGSVTNRSESTTLVDEQLVGNRLGYVLLGYATSSGTGQIYRYSPDGMARDMLGVELGFHISENEFLRATALFDGWVGVTVPRPSSANGPPATVSAYGVTQRTVSQAYQLFTPESTVSGIELIEGNGNHSLVLYNRPTADRDGALRLYYRLLDWQFPSDPPPNDAGTIDVPTIDTSIQDSTLDIVLADTPDSTDSLTQDIQYLDIVDVVNDTMSRPDSAVSDTSVSPDSSVTTDRGSTEAPRGCGCRVGHSHQTSRPMIVWGLLAIAISMLKPRRRQ